MYTREERVNFVLSVIEDKKPRVIVVDGKCASGKTTLQEDLGKHISFSLVSMDDFSEQRAVCPRGVEMYTTRDSSKR